MARTIIAELVLALKEDLSTKGPKAAKALRDIEKAVDGIGKNAREDAAGLDVLSRSLKDAEKIAREFAKQAGPKAGWGSGFQKQVDRLKLSARELDTLKKSWKSLADAMKDDKNQAFRADAITRWKNEAISSIAAVRAAQEQLTKDAEKEATARAAAEARAAAVAAREVAAQAKAAAREKVAAARLAERAAREAAKEEKRAVEQAERAKARAAREAAQERARAAREAARAETAAAREAARQVAAAEKAAAKAAQGAANERRNIARQTGQYLRRELGYFVGLGAGTYMAGRAGRYIATEGAEAEREKARDYLAGLSGADTARIGAASLSASQGYPSVAGVTMHSLIREGANTALGLENTLKLAPDMARALAVLQSSKGSDVALSSMERFVRGLDTLGKNTDPAQITALLNGIVKARGVVGLEFDPGDVFTVAKRAKSGGAALSDRFVTEVIPPLVADLGADQVGTALGSMVSQIIGNRGAKKSIGAQWELGMRGPNGVADVETLLSDPYQWTMKTLIPLMEKRGFDTRDEEEMIRVTSAIFSNQRVADLFARMIIQRDQYGAIIAKERGAPGLEAADAIRNKDPFVAMQGIVAQTQNLIAALTGPSMPAAIEVMNNIASGIGSLAETLSAHPDLAKMLGGVALGLAALAGAAVIASGVLSVVGLARIGLGGVAGATGAAAASGGGAAAAAGGGLLGWLSRTGASSVLALEGLANYTTPAEDKKLADVDRATSGLRGLYGVDTLRAARSAYQPWWRKRSIDVADENDPGYIGRYLGDMSNRRYGGGAAPATRMGGRFGQYSFPAGQAAGAEVASGVAQGIAANQGRVDAQATSLFSRIKSLFSSGVDVPVRIAPAGANAFTMRGAASPPSTTSPSVPGRASGGSVYAGSLYQVNEFGREYFSPGVDGQIIRPGGRGTSMRNVFHISGAGDPEAVAQRIAEIIDRLYRGSAHDAFSDFGLDTA